MKKAVVIGGSSGIGLAVSKSLISRGYYIENVSRNAPTDPDLNTSCLHHNPSDLRFFDEELFARLSLDTEVDVLFVAAGIGRIATFEQLHFVEIEKTFMIDTVAGIRIIKSFYHRIKSDQDFFCGMMGSIAGLVNSPMFSVYAAAKAGICRFVECINIELESSGIKNRILEVSPGFIKGTGFYGGENDPAQNHGLADDILKHLYLRNTRYIPLYDEIYKKVIERNFEDSHTFGLESYRYKKGREREQSERKPVIGYLSGTFDLFHVGHLNLIQRAKEQCDYLIVGVHDSGAWKGKETFIPFDERKRIVAACQYVDKVVDSCLEDSDAWDLWHFDKLFVGSDYKGTERFARYETYFDGKGVKIVYFPYTQSTSSTQLRSAIKAR